MGSCPLSPEKAGSTGLHLPPQPPFLFLRFFFCWQDVKKNTVWLRKSQLTP
jgi:hypothetical protein